MSVAVEYAVEVKSGEKSRPVRDLFHSACQAIS